MSNDLFVKLWAYKSNFWFGFGLDMDVWMLEVWFGGLDDIPARFIRDGAPILKIPITFIVNLSITSGTVPGDMKVARVKPLYKKNSSLEAGNYRPVSKF